MNGKVFRTDVNGLRAWAVAAVVLFHFQIPGFAGGYIGVDVFFVISGFLMTGIIARGLQGGAGRHALSFLWGFYLARGKRILPALLVLCAALFVCGYFLLSADEYIALGQQVTSAILFFSNLKFWREAGYFSPTAHDLWLLHTWSLSVEWQFYLLLPVALLLVWKLRPQRRALLLAMVAMGLGSLALCLVETSVVGKPTTSFFLLPCRAWEMTAGGLVALTQYRPPASRPLRLALQTLGLALIALAAVGFGGLAWPDWHALVPVAGAALVIFCAEEGSPLTRWSPVQWIGRCSYSIYLWHWPLVIALHYTEQQHNPQAILLCLALTLVLGYGSYSVVETWMRQPLDLASRLRGSMALCAAVAVLVVPGILISKTGGFPARLTPQENVLFAAARDKIVNDDCHILERGNDQGCLMGGPVPGVVVLGDSHAGALFNAVQKSLPGHGLGALKWTLAGCATMAGMHQVSDPAAQCARFNDWVLKRLSTLPADVPVVIINRTSLYLQGPNREEIDTDTSVPDIYFTTRHAARGPDFYREVQQHLVDTACTIAKTRPVYMMRPTPEMRVNVPEVLARSMIVGRPRDISVSLDDYRARNALALAAQDAAQAQCGVKLLDPLPYICRDGKCEALAGQKPMYYDDNHLSTHGSEYLVPMFAQMFDGSAGGAGPRQDSYSASAARATPIAR